MRPSLNSTSHAIILLKRTVIYIWLFGLMLYDLCKQLKSCRDGQLTYPHCSWASLLETGYPYLAHIILLLFILSRWKKSKQHALHDNLLFKAIIQYVQYALAHILQKSMILWTERQQPFLIHSITFSLI